jgi:1-acyl-sn-glycerol-3-phosphate acyltransferase
MILLRSVVYYILLFLSVGIFGIVIVVGGLLGSMAFADRWSTRWGRFNLYLQDRICRLRYRISGLEHLPDRACIIMSKHQSAWETIALRGLLPCAQSWVLKQELMRLPIFGTGLRIVESIPIDRAAGRRAVLKLVQEGIDRLSRGRWVIIFPEGTRTAPGERRKYGLGGGLLAERSGAPVVPIAHNAGVFWRRRGVKKLPGTVDIVFGPAIHTRGRKAADIMRDVEGWIEAEQEKLPLQAIDSK